MTVFGYGSDHLRKPLLGLIVLQADETIEGDFRTMLSSDQPLLTSRVASGTDVTTEALQEMAAHLTGAALLFPRAAEFAAMGYGCTSGTAQIGTAQIAKLVQAGAVTDHVSEPVSALAAACRALGINQLAFLSPYVADVSDRVCDALAQAGVFTPVFGSFNVSEEAKVARIDATSIIDAARALADQGGVEAIFLSCTNLRTLSLIDMIEAKSGLICLSSNQVLCWHMALMAGVTAQIPGALGQVKRPAN